MNLSFLILLNEISHSVAVVMVRRWLIFLPLMFVVVKTPQLQFRSDFVGMKFSFHAVSPTFALIDDTQQDFFKKDILFIPEYARRINCEPAAMAKERIFSNLQSGTSGSSDIIKKNQKILLKPLEIKITDAVANEKFYFRFKKISAHQVKVVDIISLKSFKTMVALQKPVKKDELTSEASMRSLSNLQPPLPTPKPEVVRASIESESVSEQTSLPLEAKQQPEKVITADDEMSGLRAQNEAPSFGGGVENKYPKIISGRLDIMDGAYAGPDANIVVYREYQGQILEAGSVDIQKGIYTLHASETRGRIVAEIRHPRQGVTARGYGALYAAEATKPQEKTISNVNVVVSTIRQGLAAQVLDNSGFKANKSLPGAVVSLMGFDIPKSSVQDGSVENDIFTGLSQYILVSQKQGYLPTLSFGRSELLTDIPMYRKEYFKDLYLLAYSEDLSTSKGSAFGRITKNGTPLARSQVEVLNEPQSKIVYLDEKGWPDPNLKFTSSNGGYFALGLNVGLTAIRVQNDNLWSEVKVIPVDFGVISKLDIDLSRPLKLSLSVYDRLNPNQMVESKAKAFASAYSAKRDSPLHSTIIFSKGDDPLFVEIDSRPEDLPVTLTLKRSEGKFSVPTVEKKWIQSLYGQFKITSLQSRGLVVGFLDHAENFEVFIDQFSPNGGETLYYFDQEGKIIPQIAGAQNAAGYVLLNAQEGLRNVLLRNLTTGQLSADTAYVEAGTSALLIHEF